MSKAINAALIDSLENELKNSDSCVLVGTVGMTVAEASAFRNKLRGHSFRMRVVKNALAAKAFDRHGCNGLGDRLMGMSAVVYGGEGAIAISKMLVAEKKTLKEKLVIHGGYSEGEVVDAAGVDALSRVPGRPELLSMTLGGLAGPISGMSRNLDGLLTEMHGLLTSLADQKEKAGSAA